jgi:hypothetical protein
MRQRRISRIAVAGGGAVAAVAALALVFLPRPHSHVGRQADNSGLVEVIDGVPVGVEHSRAGVLAAADDYVAVSSQTLEQDPRVFAALVSEAYAPQLRSRVLGEAQEIRASDTQNMANYAQGGRGLASVVAQRLDSYSPTTAAVTSWLGGIVWGPHLTPRQTWSLIDTTLAWSGGRWVILDSHLDATPAPVPAIVYVQAGSDASVAFARLDGMSSPLSGIGG